jgi:nucleotide-binding universal stress UspA family protein
VHLTGTETDSSALGTALLIARLFEGHLECFYFRMDMGAIVRTTAGMPLEPAGAIPKTLNRLQVEDMERANNAREAFERFCETERLTRAEKPSDAKGVSAVWRECAGVVRDRIIGKGRFHDLVVVSRKSKTFVGLTPADLGAVVFGCGRPVVIAPQMAPTHIAKKVAIAWKDTAEAARAVSAATPFMSRTAHAVILSAGEDNQDAMECVRCAEEMADNIRWHNCPVGVKYLLPGGRRESDTILEAARDAGADLLVSGAYGHSRMRETIFGGFTQRLLEGADLPVFLFH